MKQLLATLLCVAAVTPAAMADTGLYGTVVDAETQQPVANANVLIADQGILVMTDEQGKFTIANAAPGGDVLKVVAFGYEEFYQDILLQAGNMKDLGRLSLTVSGYDADLVGSDTFIFDEEEVMEDEGLSQYVGTIQGSTDDIYYQMSNYNFSTVYTKTRGLDYTWQAAYIDGLNFNDPLRGSFSYSTLGSMTSSAFRSKEVTIGSDVSSFGFGTLAGATNITTYASEYAPGFRGNLSYTNSNYMMRAMLQYNTGLNSKGWAFSASVIGRYAPEGVIEGTFYNSVGYALSLQKVFNPRHSLNLSTWGAPTQRATSKATTEEAYRLAGNNLYNPSWGWLNGKKLSDRITESFDPTAVLTWLWKPKAGTTLNTSLGFHYNLYNRTGLNWYQAYDPRPDYYRNLPSYYTPTAPEGTFLYEIQQSQFDYMTQVWEYNPDFRQLQWDQMYQTNLLNCRQYDRDSSLRGQSTYMLENRHSNTMSIIFGSTLNHRLSEKMTLQAGASFNHSDGHYYKTVRDLLGGEFWRDVDNFSERDFAGDKNILQNDMNHPYRRVTEGDTFGYDYNIRHTSARAWAQNQIVTRFINAYYGLEGQVNSFQRHGNMRNGRAPENSFGNGERHTFGNFAAKAGVTWKINGRNYFVLHVAGGTRSPRPYDAYVSARTKDDVVVGMKNEKYIGGDISYTWNYSRFRGSITGYFSHVFDAIRHSFFYDYEQQAAMNYTISGLETEQKGIELGLEYKIWNGLSIAGAGHFSRAQYKNNPMGVRNYENGAEDDIYRRTYIKNYYIGCTPQLAGSLALKYNINMWFFEVNANWLGQNYVDLAFTRHEEMPELWKRCTTIEGYEEERAKFTHQERLNNAFYMNASIGKVWYTKFGSLNLNVSANNFLNNRDIQMSGYQEGKIDFKTFDVNKYPNKYTYAQGIKVFVNLGIRF